MRRHFVGAADDAAYVCSFKPEANDVAALNFRADLSRSIAHWLCASRKEFNLKGYVFTVKHFRFGTARDRHVVTDFNQTTKNVTFLLKERDFTVTKKDERAEQAQIRATKGGIEFIVDIDATGTGAKIHMEANQAGNDGELEFFLNELEHLP